MTMDEAQAHAARLNETGKHRDGWFYYAACHDGGTVGAKSQWIGQWFVMRRPKRTEVAVAIYADGRLSIREFGGLS